MNIQEEELTYEIIQERKKELIDENNEEWTYESLWEWKQEQDRLIAEGQIQRPQRIIRPFTPEEQEIVRRGRTLEVVLKSIEEKYGKK